MAEKTSPLGEHFRLMESRISRQIEHITELRAVGQDTSEAIRKLQLLKTALNEMRFQLGRLAPTSLDDKRPESSNSLTEPSVPKRR